MAYYAYKTVRDLLPEHIIKQMGDDYEGAADYDGDQWYAAEAYILELLEHRKELLEALQITRGNIASLGPAGALTPYTSYQEWLAMVDAAIAKALGKPL